MAMDKEREEVPPCPFDELPVRWHVPADYEEAVEMLRRARRDINKLNATLTAQQEPVAWVNEKYNALFFDQPHIKVSAAYESGELRPLVYGDTAPPSGVREGMLRAAEIVMWREFDDCDCKGCYYLRLAHNDITRAAEQVNAEGQERIPFRRETWPEDADGDKPFLCTECGTPVRYGSRHSQCAPTPQPADGVVVPREILAEVLSHYGRSIDMHLCVAKHLPTLQALLAAAKEPRK